MKPTLDYDDYRKVLTEDMGSSEDYIDAEHRQIITHLIKPTENFSIVTKAYKTNF
jgi:Fe(3+) dicitrate transport protein